MNERIRELAEQAWVYQVRVLNEPDGSRTYTEKEKVFDKEKFAELIVKECAKVADDGFASSNFGNGITGHQLLKHFGVE